MLSPSLCVYRAQDFRTDYGNISELCSIIPSNVNLMALTATVTSSVRKLIMNNLCMDSDTSFVIESVPNKKNIHYEVISKPMIGVMVKPIVQLVKKHGVNMPKTVIFCRTYKELTEVSTYLMDQLYSNNLLYTAGNLKTPICEIYTAATDNTVKSDILPSFTAQNGHIRIVIATIAFGLGLDAPNVHKIIHWGSADSVAAYIQETGRAGRDGQNATATLFYSNKDISTTSTVSDGMKNYCKNVSLCRRKLLMKEFTQDSIECLEPLHVCCDVCAVNCTCDTCFESILLSEEESVIGEIPVRKHVSMEIKKQRDAKNALTGYRDRLCLFEGNEAPLLFGKEVLSGIPNSLIIDIAKNCSDVFCANDLCSMGVMSQEHAQEMYTVIKNVLS